MVLLPKCVVMGCVLSPDFLHDEHILIKDKFSVETLSGMYYVELLEDMVKVSMGPVNLNVGSPDLIETLDARTTYKFDNYFGYVLAVGTLHTVVYKHENGQMNILEVGPKIQNSTLFTDQTNVNFIDIINEHTIRVETYERGAGWTLSCGTGVSASVFHALLKGSIKGNKIHVYVPGGELDCIIHGPDIYLIGPAIRIMDGKYEKNNIGIHRYYRFKVKQRNHIQI